MQLRGQANPGHRPVNLGGGVVREERRRDMPVLSGQQELDQTHHAGGGLCVSGIGFRGP
ncbi:Uncharacterised protein [Mycobacteroides abscessus subsp. abscessus]|nr:Uncharacterised protein [Mycobacteroides abscessus subsp. abscessus]